MKTKIWAHRGASGYAPENTLEAFSLAVDQKADGIELDIQLTKDHQIVVIHDEYIDRVSNGCGKVMDYTLAELRKLDFNNEYKLLRNIKIPTLREVYELMKPNALTINVELKTGLIPYPGIEEQALSLAAEMNMEDRIIYSSFNHYTLVNLKRLNRNVKTGLLFQDWWIDVIGYMQKLGVDALHPPVYQLMSGPLMANAKEKNVPLRAWFIHKEKVKNIKYLKKENIDTIITNFPDIAIFSRDS